MEWILNQLERQVQHVVSAPVPFFVVTALITLLVIYVLSDQYESRYRDRLESKDTQISLLKDQLDKALRECSQIADVTKSAQSNIESKIEKRNLTTDQISKIRAALDLSGFSSEQKLDIAAEGGCSDCATFQNELYLAFSAIQNVKVAGNSSVFGPSNTYQTGLVVYGQDISNKETLANRVSVALSAAGLNHKLVEEQKIEGRPDARIEVQTPRKY